MTVTVTAQFETLSKEESFETRINVTDSSNIGMDVFVFDTETAAFSHVATVFDYETYPATRDSASAMNLPFYRGRSILRTDSRLVKAEEFETLTKSRITILCRQWDIVRSDFATAETVTFSSSDSN